MTESVREAQETVAGGRPLRKTDEDATGPVALDVPQFAQLAEPASCGYAGRCPLCPTSTLDRFVTVAYLFIMRRKARDDARARTAFAPTAPC